jgi:hypothetical protein
MTDLHERIRAEVERRLEVAKAATPGPWRGGDWNATFGTEEREINAIEHAPEYGPFPAQRSRDIDTVLVISVEDGWDAESFIPNVAHMILHDPADAIRRYERDLRVLGRHPAPMQDDGPILWTSCRRCREPWPCPEITDLAESLGIVT